ncbi:MAG: acylphosphatase [Chloroflexota bacterium]|nr:acylphosphatase [Chloroflexota bacterium]
MIEQRAIRVHGRVQGVSFRMAARDQARQLGVRGIARNEADGSVAIEAEGEPAALDAFVAWCQQGPPAARVERVEVTRGEPSGHESFRIG